MPRRRIRIVLAVAALTVIAAASGFAGLWVGATTGEDTERGAWSLLGVRDGGRTLVIAGPDLRTCGSRSTVTVDESQSDRVVVEARELKPRGSSSCLLMVPPPEQFTVRLERPIVGRAVVGKRRKLRQANVLALDDDFEKYVDRRGRLYRPLPVPDGGPPSVVGLRFRDARHALCNAGFEAHRPRGNAHIGMVVAQRAPAVQTPPRATSYISCTNGVLPAVELDVWAR